MASFGVFDDSSDEEEQEGGGFAAAGGVGISGHPCSLPAAIAVTANSLLSRTSATTIADLVKLEPVGGDSGKAARGLQRCLMLFSSALVVGESTSRDEMIDAARVVEKFAWSHLEENKKWLEACWREAYIYAHVIIACCLVAESSAQEAMQHVDKASVVGGNLKELKVLSRLIDPMARKEKDARAHKSHFGFIPKMQIARGATPHPEAAPVPRWQGEARISPEVFFKDFFSTATPLVLPGISASWQALEKWRDLDYLSCEFGHRVVPIELGRHSEGGTWRESFATVDDFIRDYIVPSCKECSKDAFDALAAPLPPPQSVGYLAQHTLFEQTPRLLSDFEPAPADLCGACNRGEGIQRVNAWFGTHGTVTPLHFDSYDNFLCQVSGCKFVRLFSPSQTPRLYAVEKGADLTRSQGNISAVDVESPDLDAHPDFVDAEYMDVVLREGDTLFIPKYYWHYVRSLSPSFSLNFWF